MCLLRQLILIVVVGSSFADNTSTKDDFYFQFAAEACEKLDNCELFKPAMELSNKNPLMLKKRAEKYLESGRHPYIPQQLRALIGNEFLTKRFINVANDTGFSGNYFFRDQNSEMSIYDSVNVNNALANSKYPLKNKQGFFEAYICAGAYPKKLDSLIVANPERAIEVYSGSFHNYNSNCGRYNERFLKLLDGSSLRLATRSKVAYYLNLKGEESLNLKLSKLSVNRICEQNFVDSVANAHIGLQSTTDSKIFVWPMKFNIIPSCSGIRFSK